MQIICAAVFGAVLLLPLAPYAARASYGEGGYYSYGQGSYSAAGHVIASGSFSTPNCVPALSASCTFSPTSVNTGQVVTWSASASGGTGNYQYTWSGTDGLSGSTQSVQKSYSTGGTKTGQVEVRSGSQQTTVACTGAGGATGVTVTAVPAINSFNSNPSSLASGSCATLSWTTSNATSCSISPGIGSVPTSGNQSVCPTSTTTYTINCNGATDTETVTVLPQCDDNIDNDGDGKKDQADPGCVDEDDNDETDTSFGPPAWKEVPPE